MILPPDKYSFPSGHSITAFAIALSIGLFYPNCKSVLLAVAMLIASSRIILGMHFLSDVLAGSAIGIALGTSASISSPPSDRMRHERWRLPAARFAKFHRWFDPKYFLTRGRKHRALFFVPSQRLIRHFVA